MASGEKKVTANYVDRELSDAELRMMDTFAVRTGDGGGAAGHDVDDNLDDELQDFLRLSRRIAALDEPAPAASVRGRVLSEAVKVATEREAAPANGLLTMLLALMRPGPVLAIGALAALAVAISVRQGRVPVADHEASMVAMHDAPASPSTREGRAAAASLNAQDLGAEPAERAAAQDEASSGAAPVAAAPTPENGTQAMQPAAADDEAIDYASKDLPAKRLASPRPTKAIAARPASVGPNGAPVPGSSESDAREGTASVAGGGVKKPMAHDELNDVRQRQPAQNSDDVVAVDRPSDEGNVGDTSARENTPLATTAKTPPPAPARGQYGRRAYAEADSAAPTGAAEHQEERFNDSKAGKLKKTSDRAAEPAASVASVDKEQSKAGAEPSGADSAASKTTQAAAADGSATQQADIASLHRQIAAAKSSSDRVSLLEKLVAALATDKGATAELAKAKVDLAQARRSLAGPAAAAAKAAPAQKARAKTSAQPTK